MPSVSGAGSRYVPSTGGTTVLRDTYPGEKIANKALSSYETLWYNVLKVSLNMERLTRRVHG